MPRQPILIERIDSHWETGSQYRMHSRGSRDHDHSRWKHVGQLHFVIPSNWDRETPLAIVHRLTEGTIHALATL